MNAEKVLFSSLMFIMVVVSLITGIMFITLGINGGTASAILGFVLAFILWYCTFKVCGFFCKRIFKSGKA